MSEFLRSNPESFENEQESDPDIAELAVNGLSRVTSKQEDDTDDNDYYGEDNYDDRRMVTRMITRMITMTIMARNVPTSMKRN